MTGRKHASLHQGEAIKAWLFLLPFLAGLAVFYIYAFFNNFYTSFTNKKTFGPVVFTGLANYRKLFADPRFVSSLANTCLYVLVCVPAVIILSLVLACLLNRNVRGTGLYRTLIFISAVTMPAAIGLIWRWIFNYEFGLLNSLLGVFGIRGAAWLSDSALSLFAVSTVLIWADISVKMVIILAGLQNIPKMYNEAAMIDGASTLDVFFKITIPMLSPVLFFCLVMETIGVFQIFDFIFLMISRTSNGMTSARSIIWLFYDEAFVKMNKGYASSITIVLFVIILAVTIAQMRLRARWVHEE